MQFSLSRRELPIFLSEHACGGVGWEAAPLIQETQSQTLVSDDGAEY